MMSDDEIIAVVQAHKEGKKIEVKPKAQDSGYRYDWLPLIQPKWNFEKCDYRVVPAPRKPRELWLQDLWYGIWQEKFDGTHFREVIE